MKRNRAQAVPTGAAVEPPVKKAKTTPSTAHGGLGSTVKHALLSQLYPNTRTLREYVLAKLPASSRLRRKKIASVGRQSGNTKKNGACSDVERSLAAFLDTTLVGFADGAPSASDNRWEEWVGFSQKGDDSHVTLSDGVSGALFCQSEIVDFVVWLLFSRAKPAGSRPNHVLCDGFRRDVNPQSRAPAAPQGSTIPGLFALHTNYQVKALKADPWPQLLALLGRCGERAMIDLLLDCGIFTQVGAGRHNYYQLSGVPVSELELWQKPGGTTASEAAASAAAPGSAVRGPSAITFVRSRMLYARAALNARGLVHFGLRHIHVLNRFPPRSATSPPDEALSEEATLRVMMYMFPRQFGLHNVFTCHVDRFRTTQKFQDYTLREEEIDKFMVVGDDGRRLKVRIPKRLRGEPKRLVQRLQVLHNRCSYSKLLQHYCPIPGQLDALQRQRASQGKLSSSKQAKSRRRSKLPEPSAQPPQYSSLVDLATPTSHVSAFCRAVLAAIVPNGFWGCPSSQAENKTLFFRNVDRFLRLRRFEQLSLHDIMQGFKVTDMEWLSPPKLDHQKCSRTDTAKRSEILCEFLYYLFDSLLIPLIRSNFYVTDSSVHRYRLFFFRHDVWRHVAEPAMASLKANMLQEVKLDDALRILDSRRLGFSQIRLLPKGLGMRPIANLRRRTLAKGNGKMLGPSINSILGPVNDMLNLEKALNPGRLGSSMFSVTDIYQRIKDFKARRGGDGQRFYLAKVDVQGAFDTIPQDAVLDLMKQVPSQSGYQVVKHAEISPNEASLDGGPNTKPIRRWKTTAKGARDAATFAQMLEERLAPRKKNTVFVESVLRRTYSAEALMALMATHVQHNLVKVGKKFYRQKNGIPQGSVLSSALCNYFYADLERTRLAFLHSDDCLLLRLIDDFLLITTDRSKACRFVETMHAGVPEYGVVVNPHKTVVNFAMVAHGVAVPRLPSDQPFSYCGTLIDCRTLEMAKNRGVKDNSVFDSLTVEMSRNPGANFTRKTLNAFKIQSHLMFFDSSHNSRRTVLSNIYHAFVETATKSWAYTRCLPKEKRPSSRLMTNTIKTLIDVSFVLLTDKSRAQRYPGYQCFVKKSQVAWLALAAFRQVLSQKQAAFRQVVAWLEREMEKWSDKGLDCRQLRRATTRT